MDETTARVGENFTLTLPEDIIGALGLECGDEVYFEIGGEGIYTRRQANPGFFRARFTSDPLSEWLSPEDEAANADL